MSSGIFGNVLNVMIVSFLHTKFAKDLMMMMMNCFCGMVDRRKVLSAIFSRDYCQRSSPLRIFDTPLAGFEPVQNLSSSFIESSYAIVITTAPRRHMVTAPRRHMVLALKSLSL